MFNLARYEIIAIAVWSFLKRQIGASAGEKYPESSKAGGEPLVCPIRTAGSAASAG